ncbi:MAG: sugar phosphate isomerase/epimerase [Gemmataceae bacterium]|nr:sugar phosphate isomerase/epimerase [Gemmataceae bacterium]
MRFAICNETFEGWDHAKVCETAAEVGYTGLEIAPFTLAPRITDVSAEQRKQIRSTAEKAGLEIIGLHWLLAKTEGLHLNSADPAVRRRTAEYLIELARCCRDLGGNLMVFGSPAQRRVPAGASHEQATEWAIDTFRRVAPALNEHKVTLLLEPLSPPDADFMNTAEECVALLDRLQDPNFALHLDVKAMTTEPMPRPEAIRRFASWTRHFHANDANLRGPGFGEVDFGPIFEALLVSKYRGWVSVEVFDYKPDPVTIAKESLRYMRETLAAAQAKR